MSVANDATAKKPAQRNSDESNDAIYVDITNNAPTSFKNIFTRNEPAESTNTKSEEPDDSDTQNAKRIKPKADGNGTTKRNDWDMFAEQDIDSNFDVSTDFGLTSNLQVLQRLIVSFMSFESFRAQVLLYRINSMLKIQH